MNSYDSNVVCWARNCRCSYFICFKSSNIRSTSIVVRSERQSNCMTWCRCCLLSIASSQPLRLYASVQNVKSSSSMNSPSCTFLFSDGFARTRFPASKTAALMSEPPLMNSYIYPECFLPSALADSPCRPYTASVLWCPCDSRVRDRTRTAERNSVECSGHHWCGQKGVFVRLLELASLHADGTFSIDSSGGGRARQNRRIAILFVPIIVCEMS